MRITSDWHIHSRNSCDSACMEMTALVDRARELGITDYGITDHLHTPLNLPDIAASRAEYDALTLDAPVRFHFGIEVSVVSQWELDEVAAGRAPNATYGVRSGGPPSAPLAVALTSEIIERYGIEYVVGGTHWPMYVPLERNAIIREFHRQNLFLAAHPLVDIVAHPWWWHGHWAGADGSFTAEPWFDDFAHVPQSMHDEFAAAAVQHRKAVEINLQAMLLNPHYPQRFKRQYVEYLGRLRDAGVTLSIGSDCHERDYAAVDFATAADLLDPIALRDEDLWRLPERR